MPGGGQAADEDELAELRDKIKDVWRECGGTVEEHGLYMDEEGEDAFDSGGGRRLSSVQGHESRKRISQVVSGGADVLKALQQELEAHKAELASHKDEIDRMKRQEAMVVGGGGSGRRETKKKGRGRQMTIIREATKAAPAGKETRKHTAALAQYLQRQCSTCSTSAAPAALAQHLQH
jgi:hypothetical protein